jgi:hypothetical protein
MLEQLDARTFVTTASLEEAVPQAVQQATGVGLVPFGPGMWSGRSMSASWGMTPEIVVRAMPSAQGTVLEVRVGAQLDSTMLVLGILLMVFFWPAGLVCGFLAHGDFTAKRAMLIHNIWQALSAQLGPATPTAYGYMVPPGVR